MIKIYTVAEFKGDSDMFGGMVATNVPGVSLEIAVDASDNYLVIRKVVSERTGFVKSVTTFTVERARIDEMVEMLAYIKAELDEVELVKKLSGK